MKTRWIDLPTAAEVLGLSEQETARHLKAHFPLPDKQYGFNAITVLWDAQAVEELARLLKVRENKRPARA